MCPHDHHEHCVGWEYYPKSKRIYKNGLKLRNQSGVPGKFIYLNPILGREGYPKVMGIVPTAQKRPVVGLAIRCCKML
jgi:hypothetical protein